MKIDFPKEQADQLYALVRAVALPIPSLNRR